jgi:hypothetical protein
MNSISGYKLQILSCGGDGGAGQPGGNGKDGHAGENGVGLSVSEMEQTFGYCAYWKGKKCSNALYKIVPKLNEVVTKVECRWGEDINRDTGEIQGATLGTYRPTSFYIKGTTPHDNEVTFSFYTKMTTVLFVPTVISSYRHAHFLYRGSEGSPGSPGGLGGHGGLSGEGGFPGQVDVMMTIKTRKTSLAEFLSKGKTRKAAADGSPGRRGKPGTSALDVGYTDSGAWSAPVIFHPANYKISYYDSDSSDRVWCGYKDKYANITRVSGSKPAIENPAEQTRVDNRNRNQRTPASMSQRKNPVDKQECSEALNQLLSLSLDKEEGRNSTSWISEQLQQLRQAAAALRQATQEEMIVKEQVIICRDGPRKPSNKWRLLKFKGRSRNASRNKSQPVSLSSHAAHKKIDKLNSLRFQAFSQIWAEIEEQAADELVESFRICPTLRDSNSAFHALFGTEDQFGVSTCSDVRGKRKECAKGLTGLISSLKDEDRALEWWKTSLHSLLQIEEESEHDNEGSSGKRRTALWELETYKKKYPKLNKAWVDLIKGNPLSYQDKSIIKEFANYVESEETALITTDVQLLARANSLEVCIVYSDPKVGTLVPILQEDELADGNRSEGKRRLYLLLEKDGTFSKVVVDWVLDSVKVDARWIRIVNELLSHGNEADVLKYLETSKFGVSNKCVLFRIQGN